VGPVGSDGLAADQSVRSVQPVPAIQGTSEIRGPGVRDCKQLVLERPV